VISLRAALRIFGVAAFFVASAAWAGLQTVPAFTARVIDQTATLSVAQIQTLEQSLADLETRKGSQIAVLIVPTTEPEAIEQFALRVAEQWRLGREKVDDGALLLIAKDDRRLRIEVGYGLEGVLTDADSKRIISEVIVPLFKHGDFYGGIEAGVDRMIRVVDGEALPPPDPRRYANEGGLEALLPVLIVVSIIAGTFFRVLFGRVGGAAATGGLVGLITWVFIALLGIAVAAGVLAFLFSLLFGDMGGRRHWSNRGRYSDWGGGWSSGGWGGGGGSNGSGGGFSGGGGGSFGGGGASGSW
jgi:uncharacterized protein